MFRLVFIFFCFHLVDSIDEKLLFQCDFDQSTPTDHCFNEDLLLSSSWLLVNDDPPDRPLSDVTAISRPTNDSFRCILPFKWQNKSWDSFFCVKKFCPTEKTNASLCQTGQFGMVQIHDTMKHRFTLKIHNFDGFDGFEELSLTFFYFVSIATEKSLEIRKKQFDGDEEILSTILSTSFNGWNEYRMNFSVSQLPFQIFFDVRKTSSDTLSPFFAFDQIAIWGKSMEIESTSIGSTTEMTQIKTDSTTRETSFSSPSTSSLTTTDVETTEIDSTSTPPIKTTETDSTVRETSSSSTTSTTTTTKIDSTSTPPIKTTETESTVRETSSSSTTSTTTTKIDSTSTTQIKTTETDSTVRETSSFSISSSTSTTTIASTDPESTQTDLTLTTTIMTTYEIKSTETAATTIETNFSSISTTTRTTTIKTTKINSSSSTIAIENSTNEETPENNRSFLIILLSVLIPLGSIIGISVTTILLRRRSLKRRKLRKLRENLYELKSTSSF